MPQFQFTSHGKWGKLWSFLEAGTFTVCSQVCLLAHNVLLRCLLTIGQTGTFSKLLTVTIFLETKVWLLVGKGKKRTTPSLGLAVVWGWAIWALTRIWMGCPGSELLEIAWIQTDNIMEGGFATLSGLQQF